MSRRLAVLLAAVAVLALGLAAAIGLLSSASFTTEAARRAVASLDRQIPARIAFERLSVNPLRGHVALAGLRVATPQRPEEAFLAAERITLDLDMLGLLAGKVRVRRVQLLNPRVTIVHQGHDRYNFQDALPPPDPSAPAGGAPPSFLSLERVGFEGGRVTYVDAPRRIEAELPNLEGELGLRIQGPDVDGRLRLARGWVRYEGFKQPLDALRLDGAFAGKTGDALVRSLTLDAGPTHLGLRGKVTGATGDPARAALQASATLTAPLAQWAPLAKLPLAGRARIEADAGGTLARPAVSALVQGQALGYEKLRVETLRARLAATMEEARLESLDAHLWGGRVQAAGKLALKPGAKDPVGPFEARASGERLAVEAALAQLGVKGVPAGTGGAAGFAVTASGPGARPETLTAALSATLAGRTLASGRAVPVSARLEAGLAAGRAEVRTFVADALGARLTASGSARPFDETPTYAAKGALAGLTLAAAEPFLPPDARGKAEAALDATFAVSGSGFEKPVLRGGAELRTRGRLSPKAAGNAEAVPFDATASLALAGRKAELKALTAHALGGTLKASATAALDPRSPDPRAEATLSGLDLAALNRAFALAAGPLTGKVEGRFAYAGERLLIPDFTATPFGGRVSAHGQVDLARPALPRYQLAVLASALDLARLSRFAASPVPLAGKLGAELAVSGAGADFHVAGPVSGEGLAYAPAPALRGARQVLPFRLAGRVAASPKELRAMPLGLTVGRSTLRAEGRVAVGGASNFTLRARVLDMPAVAAILGTPGLQGGALTLDGRAFGPASALRFEGAFALGETALPAQGVRLAGASGTLAGELAERLTASGRVEARGLETGAQGVEALSVPFAYAAPAGSPGGGLLSLPGAEARLGSGRLSLSAWLDLARRRYGANLASSGLRLGDLDALAGPQAVRAPAGTPLSVAFDGSGTLDEPRGDLKAALAGFTVDRTVFGPSQVALALKGDHADLLATAFGTAYRAAGRIPLDPAKPVDLTVRFDHARLEPLLALIPQKVASTLELPVSGELDGTVKVAGPPAKPRALTAAIAFDTLDLAYRDLGVKNAGPLRLSYGGDRLRFERFHLQGTGTDVTASGYVGLGVPSAVRASGTLNLGLLEKAAPQALADARGSARFDAAMTGTLGGGDLAGELNVSDANLDARVLPQSVRDFSTSIRLTRSRVFLDSLTATLGYTGRVSANGAATLGPDFMPDSVSLQLKGQEVAYRQKDVSVLANADLTFSGTPDASRLDGQVEVLDGKFTQYIDLASLARQAPPQRGRGVDLSEIPFVKNLALRLQVLVPGQFRVDNNLARANVRGDVLALGTALRPGLVGRMEATDGRFYFQDHTYTLEEASVDFTEPTRIAPYIHTVATTSIQGVDVRLQANGTPEALKVELTSANPDYTQSDLLILVATGQLPSKGGGTGFDAGNFLLGQLASGVGRNFVERGVVDTVRIQQRDDGAGLATGPALTVGKRINESLTLSYSQDLTPAQGAKSAGAGSLLVFDYVLLEGVVVRLEQRLDGGFNATARYRVTFR